MHTPAARALALSGIQCLDQLVTRETGGFVISVEFLVRELARLC
jgi:hypothetical protein